MAKKHQAQIRIEEFALASVDHGEFLIESQGVCCDVSENTDGVPDIFPTTIRGQAASHDHPDLRRDHAGTD